MLDEETFARAVAARPELALLPRFEDGTYDAMPDADYLRLQYQTIMGRALDLDHPRAFSEKIEWLKLHDRKPLYQRLADKYLARGFVVECLGSSWLVPLLGVWEEPAEVDFDALPKSFVLKCTHGQGATIVVPDKARLDVADALETLGEAYRTDYFPRGREWVYKDAIPRVMAEAYLGEGDVRPLDYKFMCFNGRVRCVCVTRGVGASHPAGGTVTFLNPDGSPAPFRRADYPALGSVELPTSYPRMLAAAEELAHAAGASFVRVDLYDYRGTPYFSEFTFYPCGGTMALEPASYDEVLGSYLELPGEVA